MEMLASCANAVVNLFTNENERKRFTAAVNSGVISPEVLGQANMSFVRILALYDELESETLKKHGFNAREFLEGVKPALEQVHEVQAQLENKLRIIAASPNEEDDKDEIEDDGMDMWRSHSSNDIKRLFRKKNGFEYVAKEDPDSYEARLIDMLSTWSFKAFEISSKCNFVPTPPFQSHEIQVTNVALLSARGMVIDSADTLTDEITTDEAQEKVADNEAKSPDVAAQVEVLYDFEETIVVPDLDEAEGMKENAEGSDGTKTKTMTQNAVAVGVFEGWLSGGDKPEEGLRWKLAQMRHPDEFPLINPHGTVSIQ
jgi:hypothetical protein